MTDQSAKGDELLQSLLKDPPPQASGPSPVVFAADSAADDDDVDSLIDELERLFSEAKRVPFGKKLMIDEDRALSLIDRFRTAIPNEVKQAHRILDEQDRILADARRRADQLLDERGLRAHLESERDELLALAGKEAERIRRDADSYVRRVLQELSDRLGKAHLTVQKGLETLEEGGAE